MEKIIFRKFLYDLLVFFIIVSVSLSLITWVIQSVNYLDFISKDGHGLDVYFAFIALNFPKIFSKVIIFSYFVSLFYIIQKYQLNNEILIFWTNGVSKINIVKFIVQISIFLTLLQILLVYFAVPKFQNYSRDFIRTSNIDFFSSLITEKKFIDTVKDFTIFVEKIDEEGNMENIYIKDSVDVINTQIISAKKGSLIEKNSQKLLQLNYGQILDITNNNYQDTKILKFNTTTFNLSNFKSKSTTFPKIQELDSNILIACIKTFYFGNKNKYTIPNTFHCTKESSLKSLKEIFNRSIKQSYIILLGVVASILIFFNDKNSKFVFYKLSIFIVGLIFIILSEVNNELLSLSLSNSIVFIFLPIILFIFTFLTLLNFNKKIV